ncbi:hypothetical protein PPYR_04093 [Photinus pyralis]|uniref:Uncharacterized protein n=1 Tax=Photinus pyralis TaxID=7054 RepID=A0A5N4AX64_PHOPY|nr:hypothetical protein PPYR_04093 [Photinus pyralis]
MGNDSAEVRRNLLLSKVGADVFKILFDHFKPEKLIEKTYIQLTTVLNKIYGKKVYIFAERINFAGCFRNENESVTNYMRALAGDCSFGAGLNERMRDQLIFGINNREWQEKIIQKHSTNDRYYFRRSRSDVSHFRTSVHSVKAVKQFTNQSDFGQ